MSDIPSRQHSGDESAERTSTVPVEAVRAANVFLDALIAHQATSDPEVNERAYSIALEPFTEPATESEREIDDSHVFGASMINQAWLASQLAQATGSDLESVVANLRTYLASIND
ncbi:hypothetical protein [Pseudoclavibacter sp. RFBA6]|uniref:hypothetical protein n=1 Tax=Pseudoclavibacter sp. RFBA6 TaxID=2080573 RepID=UPI000CE858EC|nr:hypothetical protein [Pseudoclavibacter sp. RFBA6]PPG43401.1 hypothetical protein C5C17_02295 [Pseudoclavibacter sp. RFBA6]